MSLCQRLVPKHTLELTDYRGCTRLWPICKLRSDICLEPNPSEYSSTRCVCDSVSDPTQSVYLIEVLSLDHCVSVLTVVAVRDLNQFAAVIVVPLEAHS